MSIAKAGDKIGETQSSRGNFVVDYSDNLEAFVAQQFLDQYDLAKFNAKLSVRIILNQTKERGLVDIEAEAEALAVS